jgi:hypothetical protein
MQQIKLLRIQTLLVLIFIISLIFKTEATWFKLIQGTIVIFISSISLKIGVLSGKGNEKTDFQKGEFIFLGLTEESNDTDAIHYFFLEQGSKKIYCKGYLYPRFPKKGEVVKVGTNPHPHSEEYVSFTPVTI